MTITNAQDSEHSPDLRLTLHPIPPLSHDGEPFRRRRQCSTVAT